MFVKHYPIIDFHCDLLCYLALDPRRTPYDPIARCSVPQLKQGNVKMQVMAIFTMTEEGSGRSGEAQMHAFRNLLQKHSQEFTSVHSPVEGKIGVMPAIENASGFCEEADDLDAALERLTTWRRKIGTLAYISLTWNMENRFGGGAHSSVGLKSDGKRLLEYMCAHKIPVDLSHTSDALAYDILNYIDKQGMALAVLASHSNARSVVNVPRNLPDELIKEVVRRRGIIGINFVRDFIGTPSPDFFNRQLDHFCALGAQKHLCFGADFFCTEDVERVLTAPKVSRFFPDYEHSGAYGNVIDLWRKHGVASEEVLADVCHGNAERFLKGLRPSD